MPKESANKIGETLEVRSDIVPQINRRRMLLALATLGLPACDRTKDKELLDADVPEDPAEAGFKELLKPEQRGAFAKAFAEKMNIRKPYGGFDLPPGYLWKMDRAMIEAGKTNGIQSAPSCQELWVVEQGVLAKVLDRLFDEWCNFDLARSGPNLFKGPYHHELYEHYLFLNRVDQMPPRPKTAGACDFAVMTEERDLARHQASHLVRRSPFYGKGGKLACTALEAPFCDEMEKLITDMTARMPEKGSKYYNPSDAPCVRSSVVDMYLPGMYLGAIQKRLKLAGLKPAEMDFSEEGFEKELKAAFAKRAELFLESAGIYKEMKLMQRLFYMVGRKFDEFGKMEHPLELYKHN